jgi:hypothetical protein
VIPKMELTLAIYVAVAVAIAGWTFVYHNSRFLARQSEANTLVSAVEKMLQEISDECQEFWGGDVSELSALDAQVFSSYVEYRCNFIEKKIITLDLKCRGLTQPAPDYLFRDKCVSLIGDLRDIATMDAEKNSALEEPERVKRILQVNSSALFLFVEVTDFMVDRYKTIVDVTYETIDRKQQ